MAEHFSGSASAVAAHYTDDSGPGSAWEYLVIRCEPRESLAEVRRRVVEHAEQGRWELRRSRIYSGGVRKYWLRRRIMKVRRTL